MKIKINSKQDLIKYLEINIPVFFDAKMLNSTVYLNCGKSFKIIVA